MYGQSRWSVNINANLFYTIVPTINPEYNLSPLHLRTHFDVTEIHLDNAQMPLTRFHVDLSNHFHETAYKKNK